MQFFLSLEYLEATVGLLIGLTVITPGIRRPKERERETEKPVSGAVNTHTTFIS